MKLKYLAFIGLYAFLSTQNSFLVAQNKDNSKTEFKKKLEAANLLNLEKRYEISKNILLDLAADNPNNANINYKTGNCLLKTSFMKKEALKYLVKATENISKKAYDEFDFNIEHAPIYTYFYLAEAYHHNYAIDSAIKYYKFFKNVANKKNMLQSTASHYIKQCETAIRLLENKENYQLINIGEQINSPFADYNPTLTLDESAMYFTSRRLRTDSNQMSNQGIFSPIDGKHYEDVYVSYKNLKTGNWGKPQIMEFSNPKNHQATVSISGDGEKLIIYQSQTDDDDTYIYYTTRENDFIRTVPLKPINKNKLTENHITISSDSKTLYFVSDDKNGMGGKDIYRVVKLPNGEWSKALNLGPPINTKFDEDSPFLHPDGKTLYYSSNNDKSMGGYDIFFSRKIDDRTWSEPFNMGFPLNTVDNDLFFSTSPDGKRGYYASSHEGGYGESDIYMVQLSNSVTEPVTILKGYIDKGDNDKIPQGIVIWVYDLNNDADPLQYIPNKNNGSYVFSLEPCHEYSVEYTLMNKTFYETTFEIPCESDYHEINKPISIPNISIDGSIIMDNNDEENVTKEISNDVADSTANKNDVNLNTENLNDEIDSKIENKEDSLITEISNDRIDSIVNNEIINDQPIVKFNTLNQGEKSITKLYMVDDHGAIIHEAILTPSGFRFENLPFQEDYIFKIENMPDGLTIEEINIEFKNEKETISFKTSVNSSTSIIKYKVKKDDVLTVNSDINNSNKELTNDKPYTFQINFGYNITSSEKQKKEINELLKTMEEYISKRGYVNIDIVGSASTVPTKYVASNLELAKLRVKDAKMIMEKKYNLFKIDNKKVKIIKENPIVSGPKYEDDYYDTSKYGKYQYIKIVAY